MITYSYKVSKNYHIGFRIKFPREPKRDKTERCTQRFSEIKNNHHQPHCRNQAFGMERPSIQPHLSIQPHRLLPAWLPAGRNSCTSSLLPWGPIPSPTHGVLL